MDSPTRDSKTSRDNFTLNDDNNIQIKLSYVQANGIRHRIAQTVSKTSSSSNNESKKPLVLFLHGWPDGWFSWRHQMMACARSGYLAVAPDMRGYGGTDAPENINDYNIHAIVSDVCGIVYMLGYHRCHLVGHDWGAWLVWRVALMCPTMIVSVCAISVPRALHQSKGLLIYLKQKYGNCIDGIDDEKKCSRFNYMLHHNLPNVDIEYNRNVREALYRIYYYYKGVECEEGTPEYTSQKMFCSDKESIAMNAPGLWCRLPRPRNFPSWSSKEEFEYAVNEFERTGFSGGLRWYQTLDLNWNLTRYLNGRKVEQPVLFIAGSNDMVIDSYGGCDAIACMLKESCSNLVAYHFFQGCGHWIHQEKASEVNYALVGFLNAHTHTPTPETIISRL